MSLLSIGISPADSILGDKKDYRDFRGLKNRVKVFLIGLSEIFDGSAGAEQGGIRTGLLSWVAALDKRGLGTVVATHTSHLSPDSKVDAQLLFTA